MRANWKKVFIYAIVTENVAGAWEVTRFWFLVSRLRFDGQANPQVFGPWYYARTVSRFWFFVCGCFRHFCWMKHFGRLPVSGF
jgi:hypothetical protein